ncbi:MAG: DUF1624 domain-containing protein [Candidatus Lokiarchaeota archaeon]|nr:DUF1624 domain-containing protein [Candidatus Lokiarchaeota archaeon]
MIRLKSIDNFRGIAIIAMIWLHLSEWTLSGDSRSFLNIPLFVTQYGFLVSYQFISGVSRFLYYKTGESLIESSEPVNNLRIKREFLVRGIILLFVALIYNSVVAISTGRPSEIWSWFALLAIAFSLIMVTPLLDTSKRTRGFLGIIFIVLNFTLLAFLYDFKDQTNLFGFLYHLLFYPVGLHPILSSFAVFLIGTVVGEIIYEVYCKDVNKSRMSILKKRLIIPSIIIGAIIITFIAIANSFLFLNIPSFYGIFSTIGVCFVSFSLFVLIEEYEIFKPKKNYKFLFYFSYYSLTIYLVHNLLYFVFYKSLSALASSIYIGLVIVSIGLFLKFIFPKVGASLSIKKLISKLSSRIVLKIEKTRVSN